MSDLPNLELFTNEQQHVTKVKHRARTIEIDNPLDGPIEIRYHQETIPYTDEAAGKAAGAGTIAFKLDQAAASKGFEINGKTVTGADVAEWITRDYIDRRKAELGV